MSAPWTFDECVQRSSDASRRQRDAEEAGKQATRDAAQAEEAYRTALALEIVRQHAEEGVAWTVAPDLARGDAKVARLRRERDIAEGVREAMTQAGWRRSADRKDVARLADYSLRRDLMENGGGGDAEQHLRTVAA